MTTILEVQNNNSRVKREYMTTILENQIHNPRVKRCNSRHPNSKTILVPRTSYLVPRKNDLVPQNNPHKL